MKIRNAAIVLLLLLLVCACKKTTTHQMQGDTFFNVYPNIPITFPEFESQGNDYMNVFGIYCDAWGNLYTNFHIYDTLASYYVTSCLLKTDINGNELWHKKITGMQFEGYDGFNIMSCDGSNIYTQDVLGKQFVKLDTAGHVVLKVPFSQFLPGNVADNYNPGFTYSAGTNVLLSGLDIGFGIDGNWAGFSWLSLLSSSGSMIWTLALPHDPQISNRDGNVVTGVSSLADGGFLLTSEAHRDYVVNSTFLVDTSRIWVYRVDVNGQLKWYKRFGVNGFSGSSTSAFSYKIPQVFNISSGESIVVLEKSYRGFSLSYNTVNSTFGGIGVPSGGPHPSSCSIELWKIDDAGNILDSAELNHEGYLFPAQAVKKPNGNIVISAVSYKAIQSPYTSLLYEIGPDLKIVNTKSFATPAESIFVSGIGQTPDGHIVGCGTIQSFGKDQNHLFTFKTDANEKY